MFTRPLLIGIREVRSFLSDLGALAFALALPLVMVGLMLAAFGGEISFTGTAYVVNQDNGPHAERLVNGLRAIDGLTVELIDQDRASDRIDRSAILMYTLIPAGFSDALEAGEPADVVQYQRGGGAPEDQVVSSMIRGVLQSLTLEADLRSRTAAALVVLDVSPTGEQFDAAFADALASLASTPAVDVATVRPGDDEPADLAASLFPRISAWMVLFTVAVGAQSFVLERRSGTLERLLTTRLTRNELFIGKWVAYFLRAMTQFLVLFAIAGLVFDFFTLSTWIDAVIFGLFATAAVSSIGLVIATLVRTENQAIWGAVFFTMAMAVFGGTFFGGEASDVFGVLGYFTVTWWMNDGFDSILLDRGGLGSAATPILVLLGITIGGLIASRMLFRPLSEGAHG
jgi:ABC-2 type transport system permease protein